MASISQEALQQTEAKRTEAAAHRFFDMAEKANPYMEAEAKKREIFESVGSETASANFDKAQRILVPLQLKSKPIRTPNILIL